jgi:hypothetical protein
MKNSNEEKSEYRLFIDETGIASLNDEQSKFYVLSGCSVCNSDSEKMKIWADQIKFKYWGRTDIIFHSREIKKKENHFKIFEDKKIFNQFLIDLEKFLSNSTFKLFFVLIDKEKAREINWDNIKIYKETSKNIIKNFLLSLLANDCKGKIIIESSTHKKDFYFYNYLKFFLAGGIPELRVGNKKIQEILTSISYVSKNNYDIEEQIADIFAHSAKCKYLYSINKKKKFDSYEKMTMNLLEKKIIKIPYKLGNKKKLRFYKEIDSFLILPK